MGNSRLHYIDVAKGLLILMVVYGHIDGTATELGFVNSSIDDIHRGVNVFVAFYMPCFFVITGFCSDFGKPFKTFFLSSIKTILLPAFLFSFVFSEAWNLTDLTFLKNFIYKWILFGGEYWFLSALFIARILYWILNRISSLYIVTICFVSFVLGFIMSSMSHNYEIWWYVHALCMLPYLGLGQLLKSLSCKYDIYYYSTYFVISYIALFIGIVAMSRNSFLQKDCFFDVPGVTQGFINLNYTMFLPLLLLSVTGSLALLYISKFISSNKTLEFLGKNSLVIYCVQGISLKYSMSYISKLGGAKFDMDYMISIILLLLSFIVAVLICSIIAWVMNLRYMRFAIGKF